MAIQSVTANPILVPRPKAVQCGYCPKMIYKHQEAGGRLWMMNGKPACARCRIMAHRSMAARIREDEPAYRADVAERNKREQAEANKQVEHIAAESQKRTRTKKSRR